MATIDLALPRPHDAQAIVLDGRARFNVLQCGRRWGKTSLGVIALIEAALAGKPCAWFAPTYKMLAEVWREVTSELAPLAKVARIDKAEKRIELPTGGSIDFWSLDAGDTPRGRFYGEVFIDEAAFVRDLEKLWTRVIRPMLADLRGSAWFFSTPNGIDYFHDLYLRGQQGREGWASWRMPTSTNPHIPADEIESARGDLPEVAFRQEYLAEPAEDAANPFGVEAIDRAFTLDEPTRGPVDVWGVDLAKSVDWTVAIGLEEDGRVAHLQRWRGDWRNTRARLGVMLQEPALVDSSGVGDPIVEDLQRTNPRVEGFKFTATSRQALLEGLALALQRGDLQLPRGVLRDELLAFRYEFRATGVRYAAPASVHDDAVMALALAVQHRANRPPPVLLDIGDEDFDIDEDF